MVFAFDEIAHAIERWCSSIAHSSIDLELRKATLAICKDNDDRPAIQYDGAVYE